MFREITAEDRELYYHYADVFYHSEINRLDSICSNSGANVQITNNRTRIFLWLLSNSDTKFKYDLSFIPDEPLVIKKAKLQKIISHLKKNQYVLPKHINSIAKKKLGNSCEIKELPKSKELADSWLASIHFLNPDYGFFTFKSLFFDITSRACVPIDPVEPSIAIFFIL